MPDHFGQCADILAALYPKRGERVAQGVNAAVLEACTVKRGIERAVEVVAVGGRACRRGEHIIPRLPCAPGGKAFKALGAALCLQQGAQAVVERHGSAAALRFGRLDDVCPADELDGLGDVHSLFVDIPPAQAAKLLRAQTGSENEAQSAALRGLRQGGQQARDFLTGQELDLLLLLLGEDELRHTVDVLAVEHGVQRAGQHGGFPADGRGRDALRAAVVDKALDAVGEALILQLHIAQRGQERLFNDDAIGVQRRGAQADGRNLGEPEGQPFADGHSAGFGVGVVGNGGLHGAELGQRVALRLAVNILALAVHLIGGAPAPIRALIDAALVICPFAHPAWPPFSIH